MAIAPYQWDEQIPASGRMGALEPQPTIAPGILAQALKKPGFFDGGGTGSKIGSFILEALTGIPSAAHREQGFQRQLSQYGQKSMLEQQLAQQGRQVEWDHDAQVTNDQHAWDLANRPMPAAVQIAREAGLTPGTPEYAHALTAAIPGYGYTQPVIDARAAAQQQVAAFRGQQSASLKAQPTYAQSHPKASGGGGHGGGKTAATRVVGGKAYYKINGGWYDNPEGR